MGAKSRGNWQSGICLKECVHKEREDVCGACFRFSNLNKENPETFVESDGEDMVSYGKESMRFFPHYNQGLGMYVHTKGEYLTALKERGLEPYTGKAPEPERKRPDSRETAKVMEAIQRCTNKDGSFSPSGNLKRELINRGIITTREAKADYERKVSDFQREGRRF